ncbi:MAG TPA: 5-dehydro-2-deoxygluconokinase [Candidatus Eubacterium faecale]|uniref:5-dehydro-2-deoxygluconokinase n=1 Tax=Candidatus Eubacterium faecale TaxID=2838568 RepID=A0A9D2MI07_9FIRM|nr:5-dehydro-2-deoxygluconokinase [Candidatus Eubacterium faecale]
MKYIEFDMTKPIDFIPVGRIAIDFNPTDMYMPLSESSNFNKYVGGSPANIAVGLARLGCKVGFLGCVSDDQFGDFVVDYFEKEGIDTSRVTRAKNGEKIGLTFTEILSKEESSILMYRDNVADFCLDPADVDEEYVKSAKAIVISGTALAKSPSREACFKAMMLAKKNNTRIIFDIDYREYTWKSKDEIAVYYSLAAQYADIIMGSREEFDLTEGIVGVKASDKESAQYWQSFGASICVIKHGKEGSTAYTNDGKYYTIKPFPAVVLKGFGGGDGYGSAFLYSLLQGKEIIDALEFGSASASILISAHSCSDAMPSAKQVELFIKDSKEKYGEMVARA